MLRKLTLRRLNSVMLSWDIMAISFNLFGVFRQNYKVDDLEFGQHICFSAILVSTEIGRKQITYGVCNFDAGPTD